MTFEQEAQSAFAEVISPAALGTRFRISGQVYTGAIRVVTCEMRLREPGYEGVTVISITAPRNQFTSIPQEQEREVVDVMEGAHFGEYTLTEVHEDIACYELTCTRAE